MSESKLTFPANYEMHHDDVTIKIMKRELSMPVELWTYSRINGFTRDFLLEAILQRGNLKA